MKLIILLFKMFIPEKFLKEIVSIENSCAA